MEKTPITHFDKQMTRLAAVHYTIWQLARRGWHITSIGGKAGESDLIVTNEGETIQFGVQCRGLSASHAVGIGAGPDTLPSTWWVITSLAKSDNPVCFIMSRKEVLERLSQDKNGGRLWIEPKDYARDEFREAWHRLASPN